MIKVLGFVLTRIRPIIYKRGFRPKLGSIFFSPTLHLRYAMKDWWHWPR